jgi:hypothetical protein
LHAHIGQQVGRRLDGRGKLVALIDQILDELALQITFALVAFGDLPFTGVLSRTMKLLDSAMVL